MSDDPLVNIPSEPEPPQLLPPDTKNWTNQFRRQQRELANSSLLYFGVGICGLVPTNHLGESELAPVHADIASFLEGRHPHGPWLRAVLCASRGIAKSVWARLYALWRTLEIVNFSVYLVSNSDDNAKKLHFKKIVDLLDIGVRAEYIRWLYHDRIPSGLVGTNKEQLTLIQTDTQADPAFTYGGISTSRRGKHPDLALADDLEGMDDPKSDVQSEDAYNAYKGLIPLMKHPGHSQILVVGTPTLGDHAPLVWRLRDQASEEVEKAIGRPWSSEADNQYSSIKIFWRPLLDANGVCAWPQRFPPHVVKALQAEPLVWRTQYELKRATSSASLFDLPSIVKSQYRFVDGDRSLIEYGGFRFDRDKVTDEGYVLPEPVKARVKVKELRFFLHFDPLHRSMAQRRSAMRHQRPAKAGMVVVGVAPDSHAFVMETWCGSEELGEQAAQLFRLYRKWEPLLATSETVGAQVWLKAYIEAKEKGDPNWGRPMSFGLFGPPVALPRMSSRLQEADKVIESKEAIYRESLSPWLNHGSLHLHESQRELFAQIQESANENHEVDLLDALAQGPSVWKPPMGDLIAREWADRRAYHETFVRKASGVSGTLSKTGWTPSHWSR